jgi:hypothetical protein
MRCWSECAGHRARERQRDQERQLLTGFSWASAPRGRQWGCLRGRGSQPGAPTGLGPRRGCGRRTYPRSRAEWRCWVHPAGRGGRPAAGAAGAAGVGAAAPPTVTAAGRGPASSPAVAPTTVKADVAVVAAAGADGGADTNDALPLELAPALGDEELARERFVGLKRPAPRAIQPRQPGLKRPTWRSSSGRPVAARAIRRSCSRLPLHSAPSTRRLVRPSPSAVVT